LELDSFVNDCIEKEVFPGCQIAVAYKGDLIHHKAYGHHDYTKLQAVQLTDLYDLASLTKILATTISMMRLYEDGFINVNDKISKYIPELEETKISEISIARLMTHTAGFKAWIPFYRDFMKEENVTNYFSPVKSERFDNQVIDGFYCLTSVGDTIMKIIADTDLNKRNRYLYSDFGFIILPKLIENVVMMNFEEFLNLCFYNKMGLRTMVYNPLKVFSKDEIMPTELDKDFRKTLVQGYVHDQAAALLGGVSGHAGLFANAYDVAVIGQMLLNGGHVNGVRYFEKSTVDYFTSRFQLTASNHRRGLGFDRRVAGETDNGPCTLLASQKSYGHTGFTGTYLWVDPEYDLAFVFLSNRINPNAENRGISKYKVRAEIHKLIYLAIKNRGK